MKKSILALTVCTLGLSVFAANEATLPATWKKYGNAEVTTADGLIKVASKGSSGFMGAIKVTPNIRYAFTFEARGEGKLSAGVQGPYGWCYADTVPLKKEEWTKFTIYYGATAKSVDLAVYSKVGTPANYEIKDVKATPAEAPEVEDAEMEPKKFAAFDVLGPLCKKRENVGGAADGKAVWGKIWYQFCKLPVPANSRGIYYYVRAWKSEDKPFAFHFFNATYHYPVSAKAKIAGAKNWEWVKVGPVNAALGTPAVILNGTGDASVEVLVDRVVVTTKGDMAAADLEKLQ